MVWGDEEGGGPKLHMVVENDIAHASLQCMTGSNLKRTGGAWQHWIQGWSSNYTLSVNLRIFQHRLANILESDEVSICVLSFLFYFQNKF